MTQDKTIKQEIEEIRKLAVTDQDRRFLSIIDDLKRENEEWKKKYYDVADAICRSSNGVEDLCKQARGIRSENADLKKQLEQALRQAKKLEKALEKIAEPIMGFNFKQIELAQAALKEWLGGGE